MINNWWGNSLISKSTIRSFVDLYARDDNWHKLDVDTGNLGYGWIHYSLIRSARLKKILCIGSRYGLIPAVCAMACRDNKVGKVDFVDAGLDMDDCDKVAGDHWGGVGWWKKCDPKKYFGKFGIDKQIALWVMKSAEYEAKHHNEQYDYVYIDGDHSYKGVKADFELFWPKVKKGGFLAIHDIGSPDKYGLVYGTRKLWKEVAKENRVALQFIEDPGLGVIQKI